MPTLPLQSDSDTPLNGTKGAPVARTHDRNFAVPDRAGAGHSNPEGYLSEIALAVAEEDWISAYDLSQELVNDFGRTTESLAQLCFAAQKLNLFDEVESTTREILAREPRHRAALLAAARNAHFLKETPDIVLGRWQCLLAVDADCTEAHLRVCQCFLELEDYRSAREHCDRGSKGDPGDADLQQIRLQLVVALQARAVKATEDRNWIEAEEWWRATLSCEPDSVRARVHLATVLQKQGRVEDAEHVLDNVSADRNTEFSILLQLARGAHLKHDWETSVSRWRDVLVDNPYHFEALYKLGEALTQIDAYAEAEEVLNTAATYAAGKLHWRYAAAILAERQGRWSDALEHWSAMVDAGGHKNKEARRGVAKCIAAIASGSLVDDSSNIVLQAAADDASLGDASLEDASLDDASLHASSAPQLRVDAPTVPEADTGLDPVWIEPMDAEAAEATLGYMLAQNDFSDVEAVLRGALTAPGLRTEIIFDLTKSLPPEEISPSVLELLRAAGESGAADPHLQLAYVTSLLKTRRFWEAEARLRTVALTPQLELSAARCRTAAAEGLRAWRVAARRWQEVLGLNPGDSSAMIAMVDCWLRLENPSEALRLIDEQTRMEGGLSSELIAFCRGKAFAAMKSYAEARDAFEAAGAVPSQRENLLALADVHLRLGDASAVERQLATLSKSGEYDSDIGSLWVRFFCLGSKFIDASNALVRMHASGATDAILIRAARHLAQSIKTVGGARSAVAIARAESLPRSVLIEFAAVWSSTPLYQQAQQLLQSAHSAAPRDASIALALAKYDARVGKHDETEALISELTLVHPDNVKIALAKHRISREYGTAEELDASTLKLEKISKQPLAVLQDLTQTYIAQGDLTKAHQRALDCIEMDPHDPVGHRRLGEIAFAEMKFGYAAYCFERLFGLRQNPDDARRLAEAYFAQGETERAQDVLCEALRNNPHSAKLHRILKELLEAAPGKASGFLEEHQEWLRARLAFSGQDFHVFMAHVHMAASDFEQAQVALKCALERDPQNIMLLSLLGEALRQAGAFGEAIETCERILELAPFNGRVVLNMALAYCESGEFATASEILERTRTLTKSRDLEKNVTAVERELSFTQGDLRRTFRFFSNMEPVRAMRSLGTYVHYRGELAELNFEDELLFVSAYGIGDEVRWASVYHDIIGRFPNAAITCEPRLYSLLSRSFPNIRFVPSKRRMREALFGDRYSSFEHLPHVSLVHIFDNSAWKEAQAAKAVSMVSDALSYFRPTVNSFKSRPAYLVPDAALRRKWRYRLRSLPPRINVGISWRSSVQTGSRSIHYTDLMEWGTILGIDDINFVSVQYDDCTAEVAAARDKFGIEIHQFDDIDLKDDFESTSAFLSELDLVIAPCSTMAELAAAVGTTTLLMVNSPLHYWRSGRDSRDLWHGSMEVMRGDRPLDKTALINSVVRRLEAFCRDSPNQASFAQAAA